MTSSKSWTTPMADGPPANLRSLQDRLRNYSRDSGQAFGRVQRLLGVLVVNELLGDGDLAVVKGGSNLEARLGITATRASNEAKLAFRGEPGIGTITLEVAVEEADDLHGVDTLVSDDGASIFDAVGLPRPRAVPVLPLHQQIAQMG